MTAKKHSKFYLKQQHALQDKRYQCFYEMVIVLIPIS